MLCPIIHKVFLGVKNTVHYLRDLVLSDKCYIGIVWIMPNSPSLLYISLGAFHILHYIIYRFNPNVVITKCNIILPTWTIGNKSANSPIDKSNSLMSSTDHNSSSKFPMMTKTTGVQLFQSRYKLFWISINFGISSVLLFNNDVLMLKWSQLWKTYYFVVVVPACCCNLG